MSAHEGDKTNNGMRKEILEVELNFKNYQNN